MSASTPRPVIDWGLDMLVVEHYCNRDPLKMTWVAFLSRLRAARTLQKIQQNKPLTHAEHIERQMQRKHTGLRPPWTVPL